MIADFFIDIQKWVGESVVLLIMKGPYGLLILLILANVPDWFFKQYRIYKEYKANDSASYYWRKIFSAWFRNQKYINLIILSLYFGYWLLFSPEAVIFFSVYNH